MIHDFTLVLGREPTDQETDALYEAGLDDATLETAAGTTLLHLDRDAPTLATALVSAVRDVRAAGFTAVAVQSDDLVSLRDIAKRTGRSYEGVRLLAAGSRGPGGFPPPMSGSGWSLYSWSQASAWFARHYGHDDPTGDYDREIAAADHLVRARAILGGDEAGATLAALIN